jgi:ferredoxin-thioredoxin reductase catalytic subunit
MMDGITPEEIDLIYEQLKKETEAGGYHLNPDVSFTKELIKGLLVNEKRYGYWACPCRLASCNRNEDLDIICPCDYRDADLTDYNACYGALYVSGGVLRGEKTVGLIPERRPSVQKRKMEKQESTTNKLGPLKYPIWRCKVCGYLCAREKPPEVCPICKASQDKFELFVQSS